MVELFPIVVYVSLLLVILAAPMRYALPAFCVLVHMDMSGREHLSATAIGYGNTLSRLFVPGLLLARTRFGALRELGRWRTEIAIWGCFTLYAAIATFWSDYTLSALKMVVYLTCYPLYFGIFAYGHRRGWTQPRSLVVVIWAVLALAVVQTYFFGNPYGGVGRLRFTGFTGAPGFGTFLFLSAAMLIFPHGMKHRKQDYAYIFITQLAIFVALILNGSRNVFVGYLCLLCIHTLTKVLLKARGTVWLTRIAASVGLVLLVVIGLGLLQRFSPNNRLLDLTPAAFTHRALMNIDTFAWRMGMYEAVIADIYAGDTATWVFGNGTSMGGSIALSYEAAFSFESVDANRAIHNEFIRVFYEWGIVGSVLFIAFLAAVLVRVFPRRITRDAYGLFALWGTLPMIFMGLTFDNYLASAGGPASIGIAMVLAYASSSLERIGESKQQRTVAVDETPSASLIPAV